MKKIEKKRKMIELFKDKNSRNMYENMIEQN